MFAVVRSGGKQYCVKAGQTIQVEKIEAPVGSTLNLETLVVSNGTTLETKKSALSGKPVTAEVIAHAQADKILVLKFKRRTRILKKQGHRRRYTQLKIVNIPV